MPANTNARRAAFCLTAAALIAAAGCGSGRKLSYAPVEGKVTLGDAPLSGVTVTFYPITAESEGLPFSTGITDDAGRYTLTSEDGKTGAVVGKCRVVVAWPPRERNDDRDQAPPPKPNRPMIPVPYTVASQTPLNVEVKEGGPPIDLRLVRH
jgi:hypothetical protein